MKPLKDNMLLYAVTDHRFASSNEIFYKQCDDALKGGVTILQLREKELDYTSYKEIALEVQKLCKQYNVPFIINDNVELAKDINADGVHVGQDDMPAYKVREILGEDKIVGVTCHNEKEADTAVKNGADYLGVGAMFVTKTKKDVVATSYETLKNICTNVDIPVVAIAGINEDNMLELSGSGIAGVAVVSAIFGAQDVYETTKRLKEKCYEL